MIDRNLTIFLGLLQITSSKTYAYILVSGCKLQNFKDKINTCKLESDYS